MKKIIGYILLLIPAAIFVGFIVYLFGFIGAITILGWTTAMSALIIFGVKLIVEG